MQQHSEETSQYWCDHHKSVFVSPARGRRFSSNEAKLISQCAIDFVRTKTICFGRNEQKQKQ